MDKIHLKKIITEKITEDFAHVYVVDVKIKPGARTVVDVRIDTDQGISLDECGEVSRALGWWMEENNLMEFPYYLEVSSPGVGELILLTRQYKKMIGRRLKVVPLNAPAVEAELISVSETGLVLRKDAPKKKKKNEVEEVLEVSLLFSEIKEARETLLFS